MDKTKVSKADERIKIAIKDFLYCFEFIEAKIISIYGNEARLKLKELLIKPSNAGEMPLITISKWNDSNGQLHAEIKQLIIRLVQNYDIPVNQINGVTGQVVTIHDFTRELHNNAPDKTEKYSPFVESYKKRRSSRNRTGPTKGTCPYDNRNPEWRTFCDEQFGRRDSETTEKNIFFFTSFEPKYLECSAECTANCQAKRLEKEPNLYSKGKLIRGKRLGEGSYGKVFEIDFHGPKAIKIIPGSVEYDKNAADSKKRKDRKHRELRKAIEAGKVASSNFIQVYGQLQLFEDGKWYDCIIMDKYEMNLAEYKETHPEKFKSNLNHIIRSIAEPTKKLNEIGLQEGILSLFLLFILS